MSSFQSSTSSHTLDMQTVLILFFTFVLIYCLQKLLAYRSAIHSVQYVQMKPLAHSLKADIFSLEIFQDIESSSPLRVNWALFYPESQSSVEETITFLKINMPVRWSALVNGSTVDFVAIAFESAGWDVTSIVRLYVPLELLIYWLLRYPHSQLSQPLSSPMLQL